MHEWNDGEQNHQGLYCTCKTAEVNDILALVFAAFEDISYLFNIFCITQLLRKLKILHDAIRNKVLQQFCKIFLC